MASDRPLVQRPDLRAPRLNVTKYFPDEITPGYIFTAPYVQIVQEVFPANYLQPCQTGPAIYDGDGVSEESLQIQKKELTCGLGTHLERRMSGEKPSHLRLSDV